MKVCAILSYAFASTLLMGTPIAILICRQMSIGCYGKVVEYSFPFFYYEHICICTSVNTGYIIYLPNKRAEEKINQ